MTIRQANWLSPFPSGNSMAGSSLSGQGKYLEFKSRLPKLHLSKMIITAVSLLVDWCNRSRGKKAIS